MKSDKSTLLSRLHAWWEGEEADPSSEAAGVDPDDTPSGEVDDGEGGMPRSWTAKRIEAVQRIFGKGQWHPGGEEYLAEVIKPLGLNSTMSVVEYGARLGSLSRVIATETGAWVDTLEREVALAEAAQELAKAAGLAKKAVVNTVPLEDADIRRGSRDAVISLETLYLEHDKKRLLLAVRNVLKPDGQLLLTDFVRKIEETVSPDIEVWAGFENIDPMLLTVAEQRKLLEESGFEVRVAEDISKDYSLRVASALVEFMNALSVNKPTQGMKAALLQEVELWARRVSILEGGDIALYRIYAVQRGGGLSS